MVIDYSERRQVNRNRPRRQFPWGVLLVNCLMLIGGFAAGFGSGWFVFRKNVAPAPVAAVAKPAAPANAKQQQPVAPAPGEKPADPPLTFYETLPKGSKQVIIGTGLNPKPEATPPAHPAPVPQAAAAPGQAQAAKPADKPAAPSSAAAPATASQPAPKQAPSAARPAEQAKTGFTVQLASCKTREEADALKAKFQGVGMNVYILESTVAGKGTWYRVRTGKKLSRKEADDIAAKAGGQAMVILD